jgi:hypothetical protein
VLIYKNHKIYVSDKTGRAHSRQEYLSAFILCCNLSVTALRPADPPSKESWLLSDKIRNCIVNFESKKTRELNPSKKKTKKK